LCKGAKRRSNPSIRYAVRWIASWSLSSLCERDCARRWARIRATRWLAMTGN
jgi:hypothetical protein